MSRTTQFILLFAFLALATTFIFIARTPTSLFAKRQAWLTATVAGITSGTLVPTNGILQLPPSATPREFSIAYAANSPTTGWTIFFPYWQGKGANVEGFLYQTTPSATVSITLPVSWRPPRPPGAALQPQSSVFVETALAPSWSIAAYRQD